MCWVISYVWLQIYCHISNMEGAEFAEFPCPDFEENLWPYKLTPFSFALNSASALDLATDYCCLIYHVQDCNQQIYMECRTPMSEKMIQSAAISALIYTLSNLL